MQNLLLFLALVFGFITNSVHAQQVTFHCVPSDDYGLPNVNEFQGRRGVMECTYYSAGLVDGFGPRSRICTYSLSVRPPYLQVIYLQWVTNMPI